MEKKENSNSPVGVLEDFFRTEEFDSSSSKAAAIDPDQNTKSGSKWKNLAEFFRTKSKKAVAAAAFQGVLRVSSFRRSSSMRENTAVAPDFFASANPGNLTSPQKVFSFSELQIATKNFNSENLIGKGGYAEVYKGRLQNGQLVAIKKLMKGSPEEIIGDFLSEMGIMAHVKHPNTAKLIGYGVEGGMHLVLELSPNGSLASLLYGSKEKLRWSIRYKIALGTAEGLLYLHKGCQRRIIHRDIKAANILLTNDFDPQICDFGLAKWLPEQWTHHVVSKFEGTFGYLAPEYLMHGIVDEKTDVFAFGVLLLELVTGRRALDYSQQSLVLWAKPLLKKNDIRELIDPALADDYNPRQMNIVILAASLCINQSSLRRPQMTQVTQLLKGKLGCIKRVRKCRLPFFKKAIRDGIFSEDDLSSS